MRALLAGGLVILLACVTPEVHAGDNWWKAGATPAPSTQAAADAAPAVTLGRPVALNDAPPAAAEPRPFPDEALRPVAYDAATWHAPIVHT
ncbi:MAG TPA: hypothetical protein VGY58_05065, partial [Gemmataceae bacterium]|nr:hypothetical protein [Gemmataceae bacterium]